jgi:hypothetical protein
MSVEPPFLLGRVRIVGHRVVAIADGIGLVAADVTP